MVLSVFTHLAIDMLRKRALNASLYLCCGCICSASLLEASLDLSAVCGYSIPGSYCFKFIY